MHPGHNNIPLHIFLLLMFCAAIALSPCAHADPTGGALAGERPRVIVSSDIGGSDPDDFQSMVHLLLYADVLDLEGLVSSPPKGGRVAHILETIEAYARDYPHFNAHSPAYPAPDSLRQLAKQGALDAAPSEGYSHATDGSDWIIGRAKADDPRPLYVLVWGSITDVAQAIHDAPVIKKKLRVYSIGSWNTAMDRAARDYLYVSHPDLWWVEADTTFRGMYVGGNQKDDLGNRSFLAQHVNGHGALGDFLLAKKADIKRGDTPSLLYLLRGNPNSPASDHWGGRFVKTDHGPDYWTDDPDPAWKTDRYPGAKTVSQWRADYLRDWRNRMDRALASGTDVQSTYENIWALWDAEGQHLSMEEILTIRRKFGATIYFFRNEKRQGLDLSALKDRGLVLIKVAHPGYAPFSNPEFLADEAAIRSWAVAALEDPDIDGLALDVEGPTAAHQNNAFRILSEETHRAGKTFHIAPHFALFDRWRNALTVDEINAGADMVWPWLYNRFRQPDYGQGLVAMLKYWRERGVTVPTYPIFDHGRTDYSGITPSEAQEVPTYLKQAGVETVCLFQPHISYRGRTEMKDYDELWRNLAGCYGRRGK
jgi:Cellulose-binding Sde182, nucleoside hydrolase-like domain